MTYLVAFDGSDLSVAALRRATTFAAALDERVVVVSVVPTDEALAAEYDLVGDGEYDPAGAAERLRAAARDVAPDVEFRAESVDAYAGKGLIAREITRVAREEDASVVVVGSDDAGRVVQPVSSVGGNVASTGDYDVFVVRSSSEAGG